MTNVTYEKIKDEMTIIWYYLSTYIELFDHPDPNRIHVIKNTAPAFFYIVQASLGENILLSLARLLDPKESCYKSNLSFNALFQSNDACIKFASDTFQKTANEWKNGKYSDLKEYRDKNLAHNDLNLKLNDLSRNLPQMNAAQISLTRELFKELWNVLKIVHSDLYKSDLIEPLCNSIDALPQNILKELRFALYFKKEHESSPPENWENFTYKGVGMDTPLQIL
jgi:AbiU2